jgi:hypothetical protein
MKRRAMRKVYLFLSLFLAGCANSDFPFCCDQTGLADVPYTVTYDMSLSTGFGDIGGNAYLLRIISQADVDDLFNAANISNIPGTGILGGAAVDPFGNAAQGIVILATNRAGNKVGELFYNSLGGIPDFATSAGGTGSTGSFTLLNAPPGEIYFKIVDGGRGSGQGYSFPDSVFFSNIQAVPVVPPYVGMTGGVKEYNTEAIVNSALVNPAGLKGLNVTAVAGSYRFPRLGSDSAYLIQGSGSGYYPTFVEAVTDLGSRPSGAIDVTLDIYLLSESFVTQTRNSTAYPPLNNSNGILIGASRDTDGTFRPNPFIRLSDDQGNSLNFNGSRSRLFFEGVYLDSANNSIPTYYYFDSSGRQITYFDSGMNPVTTPCTDPFDTCPSKLVGSLTGKFIAFDLPPGMVHLSAVSKEITDVAVNYYTGEERVEIFQGSASMKDVSMNLMDLGKTSFFLGLKGSVTRPDVGTPVGFASIFAIGNATSLTTVNGLGAFNISLNDSIFLDKCAYQFRMSLPPNYMDTYQEVSIDSNAKSLILYPMGLINQYLAAAGLSSTPDPSKGIISGLILDTSSGRGTAGVTLEATDFNGNPVGDIRYFDSGGLPSQTGTSSKNGGYIIFNVPPGFVQIRVVSQDDSGNRLVYVYPNGIIATDIKANNSPPATIQISGAASDLDGTPMSQVQFSILGSADTFFSNNSGNFSYPINSYSQFILNGRSPLGDGIDTYNILTSDVTDISGLQLRAATATKLQTLANAGGLTIASGTGVIGGEVSTQGFSTAQPVSGVTLGTMSPVDRAPHKMALGLFDRDSEADIALVDSGDGKLTILFGNGDGTFRESAGSPLCLPAGTALLPQEGCSSTVKPVAVRSVDLNGDGIADLVIANKGANSITILLGTQNGNFIPAPGSPITSSSISGPIDIATGDYNSDGFTDLVVLNASNSTFSVIFGNGDGTFQTNYIPTFSTLGSLPSAIQSSDFNGDGNLDLAIANSGSSSVTIFLGLGTGFFTPAPRNPIRVGTGPASLSLGDLNGDGVIDIVAVNQGPPYTLSVLLGTGGGLFLKDACLAVPQPQYCSLAGSPWFVSLRDLNFDGREDLIISSSSGDISVLSGLGDGTFAPEVRYPVGGEPGSLLIADFNDDGFTDVVGFQGQSGTLSFLPGISVPVPNISLQASNLDGVKVGQEVYYQNGSPVPATTSTMTDSSGKFLIFNVPPGLLNVNVTQGGSGNLFMPSYPGSATFGSIPVIPPDFRQITLTGITMDPVGAQLVRQVPGVNISLLGTGVATRSDPVGGAFNIRTNANSYLFLKVKR